MWKPEKMVGREEYMIDRIKYKHQEYEFMNIK